MMGQGLRKGAWTAHEDMLLKNCIEEYGEGKWHLVPLKAGLNRCRKSCRLRWLNYLRPDLKRGDFGEDEVDLILRLHKLLGNRWSLIAGRIPGRTANDVKNYWNTHIHARSKQQTKGSKYNDSVEDNKVTVIRPQPQTFSKTLNWDIDDELHLMAHDNGNIIRSSNGGDNNKSNMSLSLISSPNVLDEKMNGCVDDLFDAYEKEIDGEIGWTIGGSSAEGEGRLNVVDEEDNNIGSFDFSMDEVMWDFIDQEL